jgi:hypothetical protein
MATPYNPYSAYSMSLPSEQAQRHQQKVNQQVTRSVGKKAHPDTLKRLRESKKIPRVRVEPASDDLRRVLRHPNGMGFRAEGSVEWPNDRFTQRRIADGSIRIVEQAEGRQERQDQEKRSRREPTPSASSPK